MDNKNYIGAQQKLVNDLRRAVESWLKDEYITETPFQPKKAEVFKIIDDTTARLATIAGQSGGQLAVVQR